MTIEQPIALRLADALDERVVPRWVHATGETPKQSGYAQDRECVQAAVELRRLHAELERCKATCAATAEGWRAEREELLKALRDIVALSLERWHNHTRGVQP